MNQTFISAQEVQSHSPSEVFEAPKITLLGSLDDEQGSAGLQLDASKPFLAIIYNGS